MIILSIAALAVAVHATTVPPAPPTTVPPTTIAAPTTVPAPTTTIPIPEGYTPLIDGLQMIGVAVPASWTDVDTAPAVYESGVQYPYIAASPDLEAFFTGFEVPGVMFTALPFQLDPLVVIDQFGLTGGCEKLEVKTYDDPFFVGVVQVGTNCGDLHMTWNLVAAAPAEHTYTAMVQVQTADPVELQTILRTFNDV
jgi:serine protease Do